jgi:hypothetical protein
VTADCSLTLFCSPQRAGPGPSATTIKYLQAFGRTDTFRADRSSSTRYTAHCNPCGSSTGGQSWPSAVRIVTRLNTAEHVNRLCLHLLTGLCRLQLGALAVTAHKMVPRHKPHVRKRVNQHRTPMKTMVTTLKLHGWCALPSVSIKSQVL